MITKCKEVIKEKIKFEEPINFNKLFQEVLMSVTKDKPDMKLRKFIEDKLSIRNNSELTYGQISVRYKSNLKSQSESMTQSFSTERKLFERSHKKAPILTKLIKFPTISISNKNN